MWLKLLLLNTLLQLCRPRKNVMGILSCETYKQSLLTELQRIEGLLLAASQTLYWLQTPFTYTCFDRTDKYLSESIWRYVSHHAFRSSVTSQYSRFHETPKTVNTDCIDNTSKKKKKKALVSASSDSLPLSSRFCWWLIQTS